MTSLCVTTAGNSLNRPFAELSGFDPAVPVCSYALYDTAGTSFALLRGRLDAGFLWADLDRLCIF